MTDREDKHVYEPAKGHGLAHDPFNAIVAPRPIGWISTLSEDGVRNLAPYSFFNAFNYKPPIIGFASVGAKDSLANVRASKAFVWNLAVRDLAEQMNASSAGVAAGVDEFDLAGLTPAPSRVVSAPRVAESPVNLECRVTQIVQLTSADGRPLTTWMTFGEVVAVHIDRGLLKDGSYDTFAAHPIMRGGGPADYAEITPANLFLMQRPG